MILGPDLSLTSPRFSTKKPLPTLKKKSNMNTVSMTSRRSVSSRRLRRGFNLSEHSFFFHFIYSKNGCNSSVLENPLYTPSLFYRMLQAKSSNDKDLIRLKTVPCRE